MRIQIYMYIYIAYTDIHVYLQCVYRFTCISIYTRSSSSYLDIHEDIALEDHIWICMKTLQYLDILSRYENIDSKIVRHFTIYIYDLRVLLSIHEDIALEDRK